MSLEMSLPPLIPLPNLSIPEGLAREQIEPVKVVDGWLASLQSLVERKGNASLSSLFIKDCWWRDLAAIAWDISTKEGQAAISKYLADSVTGIHEFKSIKGGALQPRLSDMGGLIWIESGFTFETKYGSGRGIVRLANAGPNEWQAWTVSTQLERLNGQDELDQSRSREPLLSTRFTNGEKTSDDDLQVLIIGAGQYL